MDCSEIMQAKIYKNKHIPFTFKNYSDYSNQHYVKSVWIRSFFWSVFSRIRTEYREIQSICPYAGKYGPEKTPYFDLDTFHAMYLSAKTNNDKNLLILFAKSSIWDFDRVLNTLLSYA